MDISSLFDIRGKRALVTGGSGGIGEMIATGLVAAGCELTIVSRKADALAAAAQRIAPQGGVATIAADLATPEGAETVAQAWGAAPLHILVNNAGAAWGAPIDRYPRAGFDKVLGLNVTGVFELTQKLLPALRAAASSDDPARVINIASVDGIHVPRWQTYAYSASKAGVIHMSRHMGQALAGDHIAVNCISPGLFPSKMTGPMVDFDDPAAVAMAASPLGSRVGQPEDIAAAVIYLASRAGAWLTGVNIPVSGGVATVD